MDGPPRDERREERRDEPPRREEPPRDDYRREDWGRDRDRYDDRYGRDRYGPPAAGMGLSGIFTMKNIGMMALLGVLLLFIGALYASTIIITDNDDLADADELQDAREGQKNALIIVRLGMAVLSMALIGGGMFNDKLDNHLRMGLIVGGSVVAMGLFMGTTFMPTY